MYCNFYETEQASFDSSQQETSLTQQLNQALNEIQSYDMIKQKLKERKNQRLCESETSSQQSTNMSITDICLQINLDHFEAFLDENEERQVEYIEKEESILIPSIQPQFTTAEFLNYIDGQKINGLKLKTSPQQQLKKKLINKFAKNEEEKKDIKQIFHQFKVEEKMSQKQKKIMSSKK